MDIEVLDIDLSRYVNTDVVSSQLFWRTIYIARSRPALALAQSVIRSNSIENVEPTPSSLT
jgi:hypothetical protein